MRPYALALVTLAGCASQRGTAIPRLDPAPVPASALAIRIDPEPDVRGRWSKHALGRELARALAAELEATLVRAGYTAHAPRHDLVGRLRAELDGSTSYLRSTTTLELLHDGKIVEQLEVRTAGSAGSVPAEVYPEFVAVRLANLISGSPSVARFSREKTEEKSVDPEASGPQQPLRPVAAVFDVLDSSEQLDTRGRSQLTEYVGVRVTQLLGLRVMPRAQVRERLVLEKRESFAACMDQVCQIELGKALAAEKVLALELMRLGETCALAGTLFDLRTETAELAASVKSACAREALFEASDHLLAALASQSARR